MKYLYQVAVSPGLDYEAVADDELSLDIGDKVVVKCERYQDFGTVSACPSQNPCDEQDVQRRRERDAKGRRIEGNRTPRILRKANEADITRAEENEARTREIHAETIRRITQHDLVMKLVSTHYSLDRRLIVFQFSAEGRIDFRSLLRDLSRDLKTRVELRQIGVRDEAAIHGGIGPCGRAFCCCTFLQRFISINVRMAKEQGLSLNPGSISGACGRLKCCLSYESARYREAQQQDPEPGMRCHTPRGLGTVESYDPTAKRAMVKLNGRDAETVEFPVKRIKLRVFG